jgi:hypothetical protein
MSICLSVRPFRVEQLCSEWVAFHEILLLSIFRKSIEEIQVSLKFEKYSFYLHENLYTFWSYLAQLFLEWEMFQENLQRNSKHTFSDKKYFFENRSVYERIWNNTAELYV